MTVSVDYLHECLFCDADLGLLIWRDRPPSHFNATKVSRDIAAHRWNSAHAGTRAFATTDNKGYLIGQIDGVKYRSHRVIWAMHFGEWPDNEIDHINHVRTDNRIQNLRVVTSVENSMNRSGGIGGKFSRVGVSFCPARWEAYLKINGKKKFLGRFRTYAEAVRARENAEREHGFHENHGKIN